MVDYDLSIPLSLSLINKLRSFDHSSHSFKPEYLNVLEGLLSEIFKERNRDEPYQASTLEQLTLAVHYYLALIYNLEDLIAVFNKDLWVANLNISGFNTTNIFNLHCLSRSINFARKFGSPSSFTDSDIQLISNFSVKVALQGKIKASSSELIIPYEMFDLVFASRGKFDLGFLCILCKELNDALGTSLRPYLFSDAEGITLTKEFHDSGFTLLQKARSIKYTQHDFEKHLILFAQEKDSETLLHTLSDLENVVYYSIFKHDRLSTELLEKLFIALLGHRVPEVRERAVWYLNTIYDGVDWQLRGPYKGKVSTVGNEFKLEYLLESDNDDKNIAVLLNSFPFDSSDEEPLISWHKPEVTPFLDENNNPTKFVVVSINFGLFPRTGFYDWKIIKFQKGGRIGSVYTAILQDGEKSKGSSASSEKLNEMESQNVDFVGTKVVQGRFIVHPNFARDLQMHEIYCPNPSGLPGDYSRGSFAKVRESIGDLAKAGINCVYLNGALETDTSFEEDSKTKKKSTKRKANPLAVTSRKTVNTALGGPAEFQKLVSTAKEKKVRLLLDCTARVSSSHAHKAYSKLLLHHIDEDGKLVISYGGEGLSVNYEDTAYLNYRKKEAWDLLITEVMELIQTYGIDGLHIDDAQTWPQIFEADYDELERRDPDGSRAFDIEETFYGNIIKPRCVSGYWATDAKQKWPNPFFIKLCKLLWLKFPQLLFVGEAWGGQGYENREISLMRSGLIPRLFKITPAVAAIYGQHLHRDGTITPCEKLSINSLRTWYETTRKAWPKGAIAIQSTTSHIWPYPAFLYKKGAWSYIDLLFFLPDIPMTFMGELEGHGFKARTLKHFQTTLEKSEKKPISQSREGLLSAVFGAEDHYFEIGKLKIGTNISEKNSLEEFWPAQGHLSKELGPEFGFDLNKIYLHYEHRRMLRDRLSVLRYGKMIPLLAEHAEGYHSHVLSFARATGTDLAIIATNFNEFDVFFSINMKTLKFLFEELEQDKIEHCVVKITDVIGSQMDDYYTAYEFLYGKIDTFLKPHSSLVWEAKIIAGDKDLYEKTLMASMERIKNRIARNQPIEGNEVASMLTNVVKEVTSAQEFANNVGYLTKKFLKPTGVSLPELFNSIKEFRDDPSLSAKLFAFCHALYEQAPKTEEKDFLTSTPKESDFIDFSSNVPLIKPRKQPSLYASRARAGSRGGSLTVLDDDMRVNTRSFSEFTGGPAGPVMEKEETEMKTIFDYVREILEFNRLGPIAFLCPELGRWSTAGGLGVMVDELSQGLAELGEEVICVSPYYERNRKGETGYLARDPDDIKHLFNLEVYLGDGKYIVGVHGGKVKGVTVYFLHQPFVFPRVYADGDARFTITQLALMAKASLELFCALQLIPSLIITNDWFTGLTAAYPKHGHFGDVFKGTKFLHIVHNLDPSYEGRLYPNPHEGMLEYIHGLPTYLFVDPYWKDRVLNPSRCAILTSDQWATVSQSYKNELLERSPLASILRNHPNPFAFPNGIPREARFKRIMDVCGNDHFKAKEFLQKKYFKLDKLDDDIAVFAFVGRVTQQKGVHLILESAETLLNRYQGKIQILVGGPVNMKEPYGSYCAGMMYDLNRRYPKNFWSAPEEFFTDGTLVNVGADFAMMPSLFEPGGIVQHEFFIGSTPVIAFETGGLRDTVFEFDPKTNKGNGFVFRDYKVGDYIYAVERALKIFKDKEKYAQLRKNAFEGAIDVSDVARAWNKEFHRLFNKAFIDPALKKIHDEMIDKKFSEHAYKEVFTLKKVVPEVSQQMRRLRTLGHKRHYTSQHGNVRSKVFIYKTNKLPRPKSVALIGSFNDWKEPIPMNYDHILGRWMVNIQLPPGEFTYKFIVDDHWVYSNDDPKINDFQGNINNIIRVL